MDLRKLATNILPFPRLKFLSISDAPLMYNHARKYTKISIETLITELFHGHQFLSNIDVGRETHGWNGKYLAASVIFRGTPVNEYNIKLNEWEIVNGLRKTCDELRYNDECLITIPHFIHSTLVYQPSQSYPLTGTLFANNTAIKHLYKRNLKRFNKFYKKKAYLQYYTMNGTLDEDFEEAINEIKDLIDDYNDKDGQDIAAFDNVDDLFQLDHNKYKKLEKNDEFWQQNSKPKKKKSKAKSKRKNRKKSNMKKNDEFWQQNSKPKKKKSKAKSKRKNKKKSNVVKKNKKVYVTKKKSNNKRAIIIGNNAKKSGKSIMKNGKTKNGKKKLKNRNNSKPIKIRGGGKGQKDTNKKKKKQKKKKKKKVVIESSDDDDFEEESSSSESEESDNASSDTSSNNQSSDTEDESDTSSIDSNDGSGDSDSNESSNDSDSEDEDDNGSSSNDTGSDDTNNSSDTNSDDTNSDSSDSEKTDSDSDSD